MIENDYEKTIARTRRQVGGERRIDILDATVDVLNRRGFDQTRFADVAEASGVAVSTLQYYFGSLESLLIEACLYTSDRDINQTRQEAAQIADPWQRIEWLIEVFIANDSPGSGWKVMNEFWRASLTRPHLQADMARDQNQWRSLVVAAIEHGVAVNAFSPRRDIKTIAMQFVAQFDGTVFPMWILNQEFDIVAFRAAAREDIANLLRYPLES